MSKGILSDEEQQMFFELLQRVCEHHVDNFLTMSIVSGSTTFYLDIAAEPQSGDRTLYSPISPSARLGVPRQHPLEHED
jgi:hypothetical protein